MEVQEITLAIETSCDETAVALADSGGKILISEVASQIAIHSAYGGVVPELASRNHNADLRPLVEHTMSAAGVTWDRIGALAATSGPGLASSLLIGDTTAKALAAGMGCPFYSINHMEGHLLSPFIATQKTVSGHVALIVSGGHTLLIEVRGVNDYRLLGSTRDDAAGEAFDKVGKMLGLPYPGGPEVSRLARGGDPAAFEFPRSMIASGDFEFSFSGLKTSALYLLRKMGDSLGEDTMRDFCASFQAAVVDVLVAKLFDAADFCDAKLVTVSGGVSCNPELRRRVEEGAANKGKEVLLAKPDFSTDNAAMIAFAAVLRRNAGVPPSPLSSDIDPNLELANPAA